MLRAVYRLALIFPIVLLPAALLLACGSSTADESKTGQGPAMTDPGNSGPYAVGVTHFSFERPSSTTGETRVLDTTVWYPADDSAKEAAIDDTLGAVPDASPARAGAPFPIIVWSHGAGGNPPYAPLYFAPHLAGYGFVVIAPSHPGNLRDDCFGDGRTGCTAEGMSDSYLNRPFDLTFALESVLKLNGDSTSPFYHLLDGARVGVAGHSFGGTDTVRASTTSAGSPYKAALAMAPCVGAVVPQPDTVTMPLIMFGGDFDARCPAPDMQTFYLGIRSELAHFLVVLPAGGHGTYGDHCTLPVKQDGCAPENIDQDKAHQFINFYATAFFETYVAGDSTYAAFLNADANPSEQDIRYTVHMP